MAEGTYRFDPSKTIGVDPTCAFRKWGWEFYSWIIALVILGIITDTGAVYMLARSRKTRYYIPGVTSTPAWLKSRKTFDKNMTMHDYERASNR
ncbi:hypothetical protein BGZ65_001018, partial [Modicella reniformis]